MTEINENDKIYIYKLTTDNGGAPCVYKSKLSLAICKPKIRSVADKDDWIVGFGGKTTIGERLIYIAHISQNLRDGIYYKDKQYFKRPDSIYRWDDKEKLYYWSKDKIYHKNGAWIDTDLGTKTDDFNISNVLLSNHFVHFGKMGTEDYKKEFKGIKNLIESLTQGHRVNHSNKLREELIELINRYIKLPGSNIPSQSDVNLNCNNEEDSICEC